MTWATHFENTLLMYCISAPCDDPHLLVTWPLPTQNKLVTSEPFPSHSFLQDCPSSRRTGGGLMLSHTEKNYGQKRIFLIGLKFSLQIFWPQGHGKYFCAMLCCLEIYFLFWKWQKCFYSSCLSVLYKITGEIKIPSVNSVSKSHKYFWTSAAMGMFSEADKLKRVD